MHLLVTAGPTREYFDTVRFISNPSSGRMGFAIELIFTPIIDVMMEQREAAGFSDDPVKPTKQTERSAS